MKSFARLILARKFHQKLIAKDAEFMDFAQNPADAQDRKACLYTAGAYF